MQLRATATRQRIIDAAVDLFVELGYSETGLTDITNRAEVTSGAFYYHFKTKEALAAAIIEQGWPKALELFKACAQSPSPGLENVIVMTFSISDLLIRDRSVWISNHLNGAFGQLSEHGRLGFQSRATIFVQGIAGSLRRSDIREEIGLETVASMVWITLHGCHLLSDALMDNVFTRLEESWRVLLQSIVPTESLAYFQQFLARTAAGFAPQIVDELSTKRRQHLESVDEPARWDSRIL